MRPEAPPSTPAPEAPEAAPEPEPAVVAEPDEAPEEAEEPEAASCEHPFVPSVPGEWRRYAWRQSGESQAAELRIEALSSRELDDGEREITWRVQITASDDHAELAATEMTTRCIPGQRAEEPWFGILERSLGLTPSGEPRWRWPARLRTGERFEGVASFDTEGAEMQAPEGADGPQVLRVTRRHEVGAREAVEVPAGRFRAWRVEYEERHAFGESGETGTGVVWVAPDLGMVKSTARNSQGISQSIELLSFGPRR